MPDRNADSSQATADWYKNAVIYALDITYFFDSNGDGIGDLKGAITKLDYLQKLGVSCIWLLPFHCSGGLDHGYDVTDYMSVDPSLGTLEDFRAFVKTAHSKGMMVIMDLVLQHTSSQHPWFIAATTGRHNKYTDYYVWADQLTPEIQEENAFPTIEDGVWTYDENVHAYYRHQFYSAQPDLNLANPQVRDEIYNIICFWLAFGIDGFRFDAARFLLNIKGIDNKGQDPIEYFKELHDFVTATTKHAVLIGEVDEKLKDMPQFLHDSDRFHMLYNFLLNNALFLSLGRHDASAISKAIEDQAATRRQGTWINFVRNNDELNLMHLPPKDYEATMAIFAPDPKSQIYDRGIRRRLPPMLDGDPRQMRMLYSLLFSLPGAQMFVYGDEIGMGDDLTRSGRNSVRLPMQWSPADNGGFSAVNADKLIANVNTDKRFGYKRINVMDQIKRQDSLLKFFENIIALRKQLPIIGLGSCRTIDVGNPKVLVLEYKDAETTLVAVHNFSDTRQRITLPRNYHQHMTCLVGENLSAKQTINAYGFAWLTSK